MAGPSTAERDERTAPESGPPRPPRPGRRLRLPYPRLTALVFGAALLLGGFALWALYGSTWLRVEKVRVAGVEVLAPGEVRQAADVPTGLPMASVDTDEVEQRIRRALPRVESVTAERSWPNDFVLEVTERQAVLLIEKGGEFIEVDAAGRRFATVDRAPEGVPRLELNTARSPSLRRFGTDRLLREAVAVADSIPAPVAARTRTIAVSSFDAFSLELDGGRRVDWGSSEEGRAKADVLTRLLEATPKARHFDVSAPGSPASSGS
ncbi:cell division protein FtsQ/DivIB [Streptomyces sp. NPDC060194]|uniref:cell division protein FtsQ/DivIB n=1 Tax=Streptomyces sp. NPDC060194 TaxID=3347069 RepID=UPI003646FF54